MRRISSILLIILLYYNSTYFEQEQIEFFSNTSIVASSNRTVNNRLPGEAPNSSFTHSLSLFLSIYYPFTLETGTNFSFFLYCFLSFVKWIIFSYDFSNYQLCESNLNAFTLNLLAVYLFDENVFSAIFTYLLRYDERLQHYYCYCIFKTFFTFEYKIKNFFFILTYISACKHICFSLNTDTQLKLSLGHLKIAVNSNDGYAWCVCMLLKGMPRSTMFAWPFTLFAMQFSAQVIYIINGKITRSQRCTVLDNINWNMHALGWGKTN